MVVAEMLKDEDNAVSWNERWISVKMQQEEYHGSLELPTENHRPHCENGMKINTVLLLHSFFQIIF